MVSKKAGDNGMEEHNLRDLETMFAQVEDPRLERSKLHRLRNIIILAICGVICGAEGWVEIEEFGKAKEAFLENCSLCPMAFPLTTLLAGSLPSSIQNSLKPVLCNGSGESARRSSRLSVLFVQLCVYYGPQKHSSTRECICRTSANECQNRGRNSKPVAMTRQGVCFAHHDR
jgi:hypothetical protein